jgi:hypothetical protein
LGLTIVARFLKPTNAAKHAANVKSAPTVYSGSIVLVLVLVYWDFMGGLYLCCTANIPCFDIAFALEYWLYINMGL